MNPRDHQIAVLAPQRLTTTYCWTRSKDHNVEAVAHVAFDHPAAGPIDAFAKFYNPAGRGMVNEVTGWLLAKSAGLPVPEQAFIALVPLDKLPQPLDGITAQAHAAGASMMAAFCTRNAKPIAVQPIAPTATLLDELRRWRHLHRCVAFDERVANADRHPGNLIRSALREFVLIDHGRLAWTPAAEQWSAASVADPLGDYDNRLAGYAWSGVVADKDSSSTMAACACLEPAAGDLLAELEHWWSVFVTDPADRQAWKTFLDSRLAHVEYLLRKRFGLLT